MKLFNIVYLAFVIGAAVFTVQSRRADSYMQAETRHSADAMIPRLRPLSHYHHRHRMKIRNTAENRAIHHFPWVIDPGDGYLYSAWWE